MDRKRYARELTAQAIRLLQIAAEISGPTTTKAESCTCDVCGDQIKLARVAGRNCISTLKVGTRWERCPGIYRPDADCQGMDADYVHLKDGRTLPVTVDDLAAIQAAEDFAMVPDDDGTDEVFP